MLKRVGQKTGQSPDRKGGLGEEPNGALPHGRATAPFHGLNKEFCLLLTAYCLLIFMHRITLIPGDGIGPEVAAAVLRIIEASGVEIEWETYVAGQQALDKFGTTLPEDLLESIKRNKVGLKGPITTPVGKGFTSVNVGLRKALDLYANLRPIRALPNVPCRNPNLDLVVVRENTESLYSGLEHEIIPGVCESLNNITQKASTHIARFAFDYALRENREKINSLHQANIN